MGGPFGFASLGQVTDHTELGIEFQSIELTLGSFPLQDIVREFEIERPIISTRQRIQSERRSINGSQPSASSSNSSVCNPPSKKSKQDDARRPSTSRGNRSVWQSVEDISRNNKKRTVESDSE